MSQDNKGKCCTCNWWHGCRHSYDKGPCRRHAPTRDLVIYTQDSYVYKKDIGNWPLTDAISGCGDWEEYIEQKNESEDDRSSY